jgi:hypothetical protein
MMNNSFPEAPVVMNKPDRSVKLDDLAYFWKLDDQVWVTQREADWRKYVKPIFKDYPKKEQKLLEEYFKYGKKDKYYPATGWFFLTPYEKEEDLSKLMNSFLLDARGRKDIYNYYLLGGFFRFSNCPWYRKHMEIFSDVYFSDKYTLVKEQRINISPSPSSWSKYFVGDSIEAVNDQISWRPFYSCVDYFVSILPFAVRMHDRVGMKLDELMQLVDKQLNQGELEGELLVFVQALKTQEQEIWQAWDIGEQKIAAGLEVIRE